MENKSHMLHLFTTTKNERNQVEPSVIFIIRIILMNERGIEEHDEK